MAESSANLAPNNEADSIPSKMVSDGAPNQENDDTEERERRDARPKIGAKSIAPHAQADDMAISKDGQNALLAATVVVVMFLGIWAYCTIHYGFLGFCLGWIPAAVLAPLIGGAIFLIGSATAV